MSEESSGFPARLEIEPQPEIDNWRPFVQWILAAPHWLLGGALAAVGQVAGLIGFVAILFTGKFPRSLFDLQVMTQRYNARVVGYGAFLTDQYPPFDFQTSLDPPAYPVRLSVDYSNDLKRWAPLYKWLKLIPHLIVVVVLNIAAFVAGLIAAFAVLFTGRYPDGIQSFVVAAMRYQTRVVTHVVQHDEYPPFALD